MHNYDFDPEDQLFQIELAELESEQKLNRAYTQIRRIEMVGIQYWWLEQTESRNRLVEDVIKDLEEMIELFAQPHVEEYERCAYLKKMVDMIIKLMEAGMTI